MSRIAFLNRDQYWQEIASRVPSAKKVFAAVAYFGSGGADYLPLRPGDELVVDLSIGAVSQGATDPREIKKLIERDVGVFTRSSLHAKVIVIDDIVLVSSANVSKNARLYLGEASILSTSPAAVQSAKRFIRSLCSEPVLEGYLKECLALYRPPTFKAARTIRRLGERQKGKRRAKLWYISGLVYIDPWKDQKQIEALEKEAEQELLDPDHSDVGWIRMGYRPRWFSDIQRNNWIIDCTRASKRTRDVGSPARVIRKRRYTNTAGKTYHMLMLERPTDFESMSWTSFQRRWRSAAPHGSEPPKRSQAITDIAVADVVLRFWTPRGKISSRGSK